MDREKLNKLIKHHADTTGAARPRSTVYAASLGLNPSTFSRFLSGKRATLGSVTNRLLDEIYDRTDFSKPRKRK